MNVLVCDPPRFEDDSDNACFQKAMFEGIRDFICGSKQQPQVLTIDVGVEIGFTGGPYLIFSGLSGIPEEEKDIIESGVAAFVEEMYRCYKIKVACKKIILH